MIKVYEYSYLDENGNRQTDITCELWGASTKHPDCQFYFSDFEKSIFFDEKYQVFQWLLECASKLNYPPTAKKLTEYALANWYNW